MVAIDRRILQAELPFPRKLGWTTGGELFSVREPMSPNNQPTTASATAPDKVIQALRWSFALDLAWLGWLTVELGNGEADLWVAVLLIAGFLAGSHLVNVDPNRWSHLTTKLRGLLESRVGQVAIGVFVAGLTFEVLTYLSALIETTFEGRVSSALVFGVIAATKGKRRVLELLGTKDGATSEATPLILATVFVRCAALAAVLLPLDPWRYLAWGACLLNLPSSQPQGASLARSRKFGNSAPPLV